MSDISYKLMTNCLFVSDDGIECPVPVILNGEEYIMEFIDLPYTGVLKA